MVTIEKEIDIDCPVETVFGFMANFANHQTFCGGFKETRQLSPGPFGVGARVRKVSSFLGKEMVVEQEVVACEPNRLISLRTVSGPVSGEEHYLFEEAAGGTRVRVVLKAKPPGVLAFAVGMMTAKIKNQMETDLYNLKRILEADSVA